ncbi:MAG: hypothetical protein KKC76_12425 [Proteobacteria bacterium]|nr:hypothetical protein [Pseudomonadota bacterium]MBU4295346.1 hypothetical protein [Pseudomonadota bacterium]MCG2748202.1 hypothetical protein [Desulfobulbaceae bacterium]
MRDREHGTLPILTHHYADINAEAVYYTCKGKIPQLRETILGMINAMKSQGSASQGTSKL